MTQGRPQGTPMQAGQEQARQEQAGQDQGRHRLPYSAGLDGLRALAVAGVFLYHANVGWTPGGFLGVDLFFVLSGYLITSLLLYEFAERGTINLAAFWGRRARRLLPAVALVIAFALLATVTIARDDLGRTRTDALSALVYLTNWHEVVASHSYFNQFGRPSLLQHLWSLAVEEQFYLFWPLLLIAGLRWLRPRTIMALIAALAAGSGALMWVLYNPSGDPSRLYYGTDTRAFTLLIGALLAFAVPLGRSAPWLSRPVLRRWVGSPAVVDAVGVAALVGVLVLFARVQDFDPWLYQGGFLLMAVVGAVLVAAVAQPGVLLGRALGWGPLRWLGARSYGIYLWHWPIMQLTRPGVDVPLHGAPLIVLQAAATTGAAALSYRYVEMPVRTGAAQRRAKAWLDRHTPRERLAWVSGVAATLVTFAGLGFGLPAPTAAAAFKSTATPAARRVLTGTQRLLPGPASNGSLWEAQLLGSVRGAAAPGSTAPGSTASGATASGATDPGATAPGATAPGATDPGATDPGGSARRAAASARHRAWAARAILAVGDSVMLGCAPNLEQRLGRRLRVDAVVGRQAEATITRLAQYRAAGELPDTVIVQIGDNGPVWYADMQHLRRVLRGVRHVVLVNVRLARSWQDEVNSELHSYVRGWPQALIADWFTHSSQAMLSDGVHPWIVDRNVYASVVVAALKKAERSSPDAGAKGHR